MSHITPAQKIYCATLSIPRLDHEAVNPMKQPTAVNSPIGEFTVVGAVRKTYDRYVLGSKDSPKALTGRPLFPILDGGLTFSKESQIEKIQAKACGRRVGGQSPLHDKVRP